MHTRSRDENSVRLSVRPSVKRVICDKMEERSVQIFIAYFSEKNGNAWLVEGDPF